MIFLILSAAAFAGDFVDVWVTTAFEDNNLLAGPDEYSPAPNFVTRGNNTFFENYESRYSDDISQSHLVLYRRDNGFGAGVFTEAAFVLRFEPFLNPDLSKPGVNVADDGSYVRIGKTFAGRDDHTLSLTGYAVDANRFRLGYSYDITWGGRDIYAFDPSAAPGARVQYQNGPHYAYVGAKTAVGDYTDPETGLTNNQAYYGALAGGGTEIGKHLRMELGTGTFQQGQLTNVGDVTSPLYNAPINAAGVSGQVSVRTNPDLDYVVSNELKLYRNAPDFVRDTYISHRQLDGWGLLVQAEGNLLFHNLIDPEKVDATTVERAFAADAQATFVAGTNEIQADFVYKDLSYIIFNIPGITSGYALNPSMETTAQYYFRGRAAHYFPKAHLTPSIGVGWMRPATYSTGGFTYVQYSERDKAHVPDGQEATAILSSVAGLQWDLSKSMVAVGEVLYTLDNNLSDFVADDGQTGTNVPAADNVRNRLGFNLMVRARF